MRKFTLFLGLLFATLLVAQPNVSIQDQKMLVTDGETSYVLAPNGDDASYFWASVSPDGKHLVYVTAKYGTFVCDIHGNNVRSMGRMNAPKWLDNNHISGMQEFYTGHDEIDHIRYISRNIHDHATRDLSEIEKTIFITVENQRLEAEKKRQAARLAARKGAAVRTNLSGLKIYVNAGHGGYDSNDRSCWTIPVPETWTNPAGYWESKSNLVKALALEEMLKKAGATVIMSRRTNNSGIRDMDYYPGATEAEKEELRNGDDRDLSAIAEEANANNVDHFLSIHTNALNGQTNYLLMLYHGYNDQPTVPQSDLMAASSGNIQIQNELTVWTSPKPLLRGDFTFYGDDMGLGVLRPLTVPGFLSEGSFHDYAPETHRLMNDDYCKLEALRMFQHFHKWFGAPLPQTGTISGWVKSSNELVDVLGEKKFVYVKNSDDQWLPLNGAKVELYKGDTKVAEKITDDWYNGVFAFYDLEPGTYKLVVELDNRYDIVTQEVTVAAEEIAQVKVRLQNLRQHLDDFQETSSDIVALDKYEFEHVASADNTAKNIVRAIYRNNHIYVLADGQITQHSLDFTVTTPLPLPTGVELCDIGFTADNYLVAKVKNSGVFYTWDADFTNPTKLFEVSNVKGNSFAVSGARWESKYFLGEGNTMYEITYDEITNTATATSETVNNDLTDKQLTFSPLKTVETVAGASFLRYGGRSYMAKPTGNADQFQLYDVTDGVANAKAVSEVYPGMATSDYVNAQTTAWVDGYIMHVVTIAYGHGVSHYQTLTSPVANIYAGEVDYDGKNFIFRLNEDATDVTISIEKNNEIVASQSVGALKKGANKVANPFGKTEFDHYSITASTRPVAYPAKISDDAEIFQFYAARGVAVDKTPTSPYFGRVYISNSVAGQCSGEGGGRPATSYRNSSMGIFVLSSDFTDITNQGANAWAGNVEWGANQTSPNYQWALSRPVVAPNGDLFVASSSFTSAGVYIMEAAKPNGTFIPVFDGKRSKSTGQLKKGSKVVCNPVMQAYVTGLGKDEVLYTYDRDNSMGTVYGNISKYNIGQLDSLPWAQEPTAKFYNDMTNSFMENGSGQLASDQRGGFFMSQYRYNSSYAKPALIHVNSKGEVDFNISNNGVDAAQQGGMAVNADGTLLAMGTEYNTVKLWSIEYDNNGKPTLTEQYNIVWGEGECVTMGVDFDAAGNLYIVSNTNERLMVYALPNTNNSYTTRVPLNRETYPRIQKGEQPEDPGEETGMRKEGLNAYTSNMSSAALSTENKVIIAYTLNAPAAGLELQLLNDAKQVVATTPMNTAEYRTKGPHRVEMNLSGLGLETGDYNWALKAKSLPLTNNEPLWVIDNLPEKMVSSKGMDIDNDYNSPYFGQLYVADSPGANKLWGNQFIYIYDATLELTEKVTSSQWSQAISAPCRITVGPDHQLYISEWSDAYPNNAYILDPANTSVLNPIFGGTPAADGIYTAADGKDIHGSISHIWVEGTGKDRVIYTFDEDIKYDGLKHPMGLYQYNIGELATPWEQAPTAMIFDNADFLQQNGNSYIQPDAYGWWISQDRSADNAKIPALIHINKEGKVDYNSAGALGGRTRGALGFNQDMTQMATAITNGILIWNIKYDAAGVPTLEAAGRLESTFAQSCWNIVFDVAGNIYASGEGSVCAWAMPSADYSCTVTAPDADKIAIVFSNTAVENIEVTPIVKTGIYTVTGQYLGTDESGLPQGMYIINGKKVIK